MNITYKMKEPHPNNMLTKNIQTKPGAVPYISAFLTGVIMSMARYKGPEGILLLDRFFPGLGWLQIAAIAVYAGIITQLILKQNQIGKIRIKIWTLFSVVFFSQLAAGLFISDIFLMSGKLHIPVPAVIIAGPIYKGAGMFMPILFLSTILLTGPAWCSYLCYFGAMDGLAASKKKKPLFPKEGWKTLRFFLTLFTIAFAVILRALNTLSLIAIVAAISFGIIGILVSIFISRTYGIMGHCSYYCPIGLLSNTLGKISPFRIKIDSTCNSCKACIPTCRYNALSAKSVASGSPGFNCTLCGDCIDSCSSHSINYKFFRLSSEKSRVLFTVIITAVHASFLGIARI